MGTTAKLLLHCPDRQGIVTEITNFITVNNGNIVYTDQYVDRIDNILFMRLEWELDGFTIPRDQIKDYFRTIFAKKFDMEFGIYFSDVKPRMALFVSKQNHCLFDILSRYFNGDLNVEIAFIISNHPDLAWIGEKFGIPFHVFPITKENKAEQEAYIKELIGWSEPSSDEIPISPIEDWPIDLK